MLSFLVLILTYISLHQDDTFFLKIHLEPMNFAPLGRYTKVQILFFLIESISLLMALFQSVASRALIASKKLIGSFSTK